jgi:hypothetical protein
VSHPPVEDMGCFYSPLDGADAAFHLRDHAFVDYALFNKPRYGAGFNY